MTRSPLLAGPFLVAVLFAACRISTGSFADPHLRSLPSVQTAGGPGAEILDVQDASALMAVSNSERGTVEVYDLAVPGAPRRIAVHDLGLHAGEEVTSVAVHPRHDLFLAAVRADDAFAAGRVQLHRLSTGVLVETVPAGVEPDSVYCDPTGRFAVVANEGEGFRRPPGGGPLESADGSLTWIAFDAGGRVRTVRQVTLPDATGIAGFVSAADGRSVEREVDGVKELVPLLDDSAPMLEPEAVAFRPDGARAVVTLQENDGVALLDVEAGRVLGMWGLGTTTHPADLSDDGEVRIEERLVALREPDGVAYTPDGRRFVTADEGGTKPKASRTPAGRPKGGGRTLSVLDARTGAFLGDTGAELDRSCAAAGLYPDHRSDNKGSEPEMVTCFAAGSRAFALVTLERADGVALVGLADPAHPHVLGVAPIQGEGPHAPEGLAHYESPAGEHYAYCACEKSGAIGVFRVEP